jgi:uncharacterized RDD family membrane protein YckC
MSVAPRLQPPGLCERCGNPRGAGNACRSCSVVIPARGGDLFLATRWRRFGGFLLEAVLFALTLGIGWLIWLYFTAQTSQTPAKRLLNMCVVMADGTPAPAGRVWLRDVVVEELIIGGAGWFLGGIPGMLDALWIFFNSDKRTLHDIVTGTMVVHVPLGPPAAWSIANAQASPPGAGPARPGGTPGGPEAFGSSDVRDRLDALRTLWERGKISADEYEERRRRILHEL